MEDQAFVVAPVDRDAEGVFCDVPVAEGAVAEEGEAVAFRCL